MHRETYLEGYKLSLLNSHSPWFRFHQPAELPGIWFKEKKTIHEGLCLHIKAIVLLKWKGRIPLASRAWGIFALLFVLPKVILLELFTGWTPCEANSTKMSTITKTRGHYQSLISLSIPSSTYSLFTEPFTPCLGKLCVNFPTNLKRSVLQGQTDISFSSRLYKNILLILQR